MENKKQSGFATIAKPTLILTAICTIVTMLLAMTNMFTVDKIAANAAQKAAESRKKVLAAADYKMLDKEGSVYGAYDENGEKIGVVITTVSSGYGGKIKVFSAEIPHSVRAAEISAEGKSIFLHDPGGKVAEAYRALTKEVMQLEAERTRHKPDPVR